MLSRFFFTILISLFIITSSFGESIQEKLKTTAGSGYDTGKLNKYKKALKNLKSAIKYENSHLDK